MNLFSSELECKKSSNIRFGLSKSSPFFFEDSLLSLQKRSFDSFIGSNESRLFKLLSCFMPISNSSGNVSITFKDCYLGKKPYLSSDECLGNGESYVSPIFALFEIKTSSGEKREQEIYMGELPLITLSGSFVINGIERVVVSQLHRSPGIVYMHDSGKANVAEKHIYSCRFIPYRGSWLDVEFDSRDALHVRIDKKRKILLSTFIMGMGFLVKGDKLGFCDLQNYDYIKDSGINVDNISKSIILKTFYKHETVDFSKDTITSKGLMSLSGFVAPCDIPSLNIKANEVISSITNDVVAPEDLLIGSCFASDVIDSGTGEVVFLAAEKLTKDIIISLHKLSLTAEIIMGPLIDSSPYIFNTVVADKNNSTEEALSHVYSVMRPGDTSLLSSAKEMFSSFFFNKKKYDLSPVGRIKINESLGSDINESCGVLTYECILRSVIKLIKIKNGHESIDDIDSLHFRRVKSIGEFLEGQCFLAISKIEKNIVDSLNATDEQTVICSDIVPIGLFDSVFRDFFLSSPMSQFKDATNILAETVHTRRLSALGPGGLNRERASFRVRRVAESHYGRICPIETPEGQNIGLIVSLSQFARINKYGFIETPYYKVKKSKISSDIIYICSKEELSHVIAKATDRSDDNKIESSDAFSNKITARVSGEYRAVSVDKITLIEVGSSQVCSPAASLIPFLEHDDSTRALMGSNMQKQSVPLEESDAPIVGTGIEHRIANDSGSIIYAKRSGIVKYVSSTKIIIETRSEDFNVSDNKIASIKNILVNLPDTLFSIFKKDIYINFDKQSVVKYFQKTSDEITDNTEYLNKLASISSNIDLSDERLIEILRKDIKINESLNNLSEQNDALKHIAEILQLMYSNITNDILLELREIYLNKKNQAQSDNSKNDNVEQSESENTDKTLDYDLIYQYKTSIINDNFQCAFNDVFQLIKDILNFNIESHDFSDIDIYKLIKFKKSNAGTSINQRSVVSIGEFVKKGQVLSNTSSVDKGELALGKNINVAFSYYYGYNFKDSIVVSEKLSHMMTSTHYIELVCRVNEISKSHGGGFEEVTRDVPGVAVEKLFHLDQFGVVAIGSKVNAGDVLVGKVAYISGKVMTPEESMLCAMFGNDAREGKDSSLYAPIGVSNSTVVDVKISVRKGSEKDDIMTFNEMKKIEQAVEIFKEKRDNLFDALKKNIYKILHNRNDYTIQIYNDISSLDVFMQIDSEIIYNIIVKDASIDVSIQSMINKHKERFDEIFYELERKKSIISMGDDLQSGTTKIIKVLLAVSRELKCGDKMAGRHGNKGVVSCVLPVEDMPYDETGEHVDIILTPSGLPSRMNIGQIMETLLAKTLKVLSKKVKEKMLDISSKFNTSDFDPAVTDLKKFLKKIYTKDMLIDGKVQNINLDTLSCYELLKFASRLTENIHIISPIFSGVTNKQMDELMELAGIDTSGKIDLYDGRTGEKFDRKVTCGIIYFLKLHHLIDDKLHARSIGPYSLVTQQPLGGKAQFGGQRFGEMEVWAVQAYGAAFLLREMLTIKSDAVEARIRTYLDIINKSFFSLNEVYIDNIASLEVILNELRALCFNIELISTSDDEKKSTENVDAPKDVVTDSSENSNIENNNDTENNDLKANIFKTLSDDENKGD